jgi:lysophospholipase L1-like esterase
MCVLMPESSQIRSLEPPIAATRFSEAVARASTPQNPLRVVDLRDSMPDELFFDYVHLNDEGRARFSAFLGQRLNEQVMAKSSQ